MINYTDVDIPYTRIIEHNHFDYKKIDSLYQKTITYIVIIVVGVVHLTNGSER
jgi:UDP-galactopyranose mutase